MNKSKIIGIIALTSLSLLAGCTTTGTGEGSLTSSNTKNKLATL